jgi:hypothetical protein
LHTAFRAVVQRPVAAALPLGGVDGRCELRQLGLQVALGRQVVRVPRPGERLLQLRGLAPQALPAGAVDDRLRAPPAQRRQFRPARHRRDQLDGVA